MTITTEIAGLPPAVASHQFRKYNDDCKSEVEKAFGLTEVATHRDNAVTAFYTEQHREQTYAKVLELEREHLTFKKTVMGAWEALEYLDNCVDPSDPDTELSQLQHALQTAEAARAKYPDLDWLHLTALIHDMGKMMAVTDHTRGLVGAPKWAVMGDTFPVGCKFESTNIFASAFADNQDTHHEVYSTPCGIYTEHCGLDALKMCFGHDEYLYRVLVHNGTSLPQAALDIVRYHSFYPWHSKGGYRHLTCPQDDEKLAWVLKFNEFDLYSKANTPANVEQLKPYYQSLIERYLPGQLCW
eukprot:jgi/Mesvir1/28748/Mv19716-RA.1